METMVKRCILVWWTGGGGGGQHLTVIVGTRNLTIFLKCLCIAKGGLLRLEEIPTEDSTSNESQSCS